MELPSPGLYYYKPPPEEVDGRVLIYDGKPWQVNSTTVVGTLNRDTWFLLVCAAHHGHDWDVCYVATPDCVGHLVISASIWPVITKAKP